LFGWKNPVSRRVKKNDCGVYWVNERFFFDTTAKTDFSAKHYLGFNVEASYEKGAFIMGGLGSRFNPINYKTSKKQPDKNKSN